MIKETPFCQIHKALNAKMLEFAGFLMPIEYSGIKDEHFAVRQAAGIFDVSHMGEFWIKGPHALELIQKTTTNNVALLKPGQIQYTCFPNGKGGIVDDLLVYAFDAEKFLLVVNAANTEKDLKWLQQNNQCGAVIENDSDNLAQLAIQGPNANKILQKLTNIPLDQIPYYQFRIGDFAGTSNVIISATGYTGAGGFEIYFDNKQAETVWHSIMDAGKEFGLKPAGLGARDTLRLEMGYCLYGNDIDDTTSPIEAGLGWITKFADNKPFIDREFLENQKKEGITRRLYGFKMIDKGIARHGYEICNENDEVIGTVTSGTISPVLNVGIGMGYIQQVHATSSKTIYIKIRGKSLKAEIVKTPFI